MTMDGECTTILCFDLTKAAGYYSQLASVLSGFAFAAIVFLIQSQRSDREGRAGEGDPDLQNVLISFLTAFIGLILATFLYAVIAGEEAKVRAMASGFLASIVFSIAVLNLFYGIIWLFHAWRMHRVLDVSKRAVATVIPIVVYAYMGITALDMLKLAKNQSAAETWVSWIAGLGILLALIAFASLLRRLSDSLPPWFSGGGAIKAITIISLGTAVLAAISVGVISEFDSSFTLPEWLVTAAIILLFALLALYVLLVHSIRISEDMSPTTPSDRG